MIERIIIIDKVDPVSFYGVNNANMHLIRNLFPKLRVAARGSVIKVIGEDAETSEFEEKIKQLEDYAEKYNTLPEDVILDIIKGEAPKDMKRDDVIRLQLMAFGFVEAGRLEFTKDYVLIMDRINKQYLKVPYNQLDFLRTSGLNFYSLQALFWNELFQPGKMRLTDEAMNEYETSVGDGDVVISLEHDKMSYKWLAGSSKAEIKMANILYKDKLRGNTQLNWDYNNFKPLGSKQFPTDNAITFTTSSGKEIKLNMKLNYIGNESDWETRTEVSGKYKQVKVDDILRRFMAL